MKRFFLLLVLGSILVATGYVVGTLGLFQNTGNSGLLSPILPDPTPVPTPLNAFTIPALREYQTVSSDLIIDDQVSETPNYKEFTFHFTTMGKRMSGLLTVPGDSAEVLVEKPAIVMVRGYVPPENYAPGIGTQPAARYFASRGYTTLAPDFFGFGTSDPEPTDEWEARFIKPIAVIELIHSLGERGIQAQGVNLAPNRPIGIWAHSNGGQIALTALEITSVPIPTVLWAPVTAPFPYSVLFYGDETADEGKQQRAWVALFEKHYNAAEFSLTDYISDLAGPLQIHHGTADEAAPIAWSDEFTQKLQAENERRAEIADEDATATATAEITSELTEPISYNYYRYAGADHNLRPIENWNQAVQRDVVFFGQEL
ncbi:alpha/beta fold hydrolase [Candidatus Woesebacteria bacterium]|nr:alpha/beta fold hydrolase [Candidatus Woesebacteria bacterium]